MNSLKLLIVLIVLLSLSMYDMHNYLLHMYVDSCKCNSWLKICLMYVGVKKFLLDVQLL